MTKTQLIFTIMEGIRGSAATEDSGKFVHPQDVAYQIEMAYDTAVINFYSDTARIRNYDLDYFAKPYTLTIKEDKNADILYVELPAQPIGLPRGQGIRSVRPKNSYAQLVPTSESEWMSIRYLEAACCSPWPFCYPDIYNKRIVVQSNRPEYKLMDELIVKIIPKFSSFGKDDEIYSPDGDYNIAAAVLNILGRRPTDNTNDGIR
jgi:hypothetical protein